MENQNNQGGPEPLKPEELTALSDKIGKGELLSEEEATRVLKNLPGIKQTIDGLYGRAKTAEDKMKGFEGDIKNPQKLQEWLTALGKNDAGAGQGASNNGGNGGNTTAQPQAPTIDSETVLQLKKEGFSDAKILSAVEVAKKLKLSVAEVVKDPVLKAGLDALEAKAKSGDATPPPSGQSPSAVLNDQKPFGEKSREERRGSYNKLIEKTGAKSFK